MSSDDVSQDSNKAIVDYTLPALGTPVHLPAAANGPFCNGMTLFAAIASQCIINGPVTQFLAIGDAAYHQCTGGGPSHSHRQHAQKICKDCARGSRDILSDRQTHRQTDILITVLGNSSCRQSNNHSALEA